MSNTKAAPRQEKSLSQTKIDSSMPKKMGKLETIFILFVNGRRLHRFQAERLGDHTLNTSICDLQKKHGIYFDRKWVKVPNRFGSETRVMSYWLEGDELLKAQEILGIKEAA